MGFFDFLKKRSVLPISPEQNELYDKKEIEVIALTMDSAGAVRLAGNDTWRASQRLIGYVDQRSGELFHDHHSLHWEITDAQRQSDGKGLGLKPECCYRLLVRKSKERNPFGTVIPAGRSLYVVRVLGRNCSEPKLDALLEEYRKPVMLTLDNGSVLTLNKHLGSYEGDMAWTDGDTCSVFLALDDGSETEAFTALKALGEILADAAGWDEKARTYATKHLLDSANDWRNDDEPEISLQEFKERIKGSPSISVDDEGEFEFVYSDDNIFAGHWVTVRGSLDEGFTEALIEG